MTPTGRPLKQKKLENYAKKPGITILCGRFEGVDARVLENFNFDHFSKGRTHKAIFGIFEVLINRRIFTRWSSTLKHDKDMTHIYSHMKN